MSLIDRPPYIFKGKPYKTANGLLGAIFKDCDATETTMVINNKITAYGKDRRTVIAVYNVTPPKAGEKQYVTRSASCS